jgi:uncharacterized protein (UPF0332 family)
MDTEVKLMLDRADNELIAAKVLMKVTESDNLKNELEVPPKETFYSSVISHGYYSIFFAARAALLSIGVKITAPSIHVKAYDEFKKNFVDNGKLNQQILNIYEEMLIKAEDLLAILQKEKSKRGKFTYKTLPQANKDPAEISIKNANIFFTHIKNMLENQK